MKQYFVWIFLVLMLSGVLGFFSISFAEEGKWTRKAEMPTARRKLSTSVVNGRIYAIGGDGSGWLSTVEEYDPVTDKWTRKADMPTARAFLSTSAVNRKIYAIGGDPPGARSTVEEYDTGFKDRSIEAKGKLSTTWGKIKAVY